MAKNEVAIKGSGELRALLEKSKSRMAEVLPRHLTPERMVQLVMTATFKNPKLLECSPLSICGAIMDAAVMGIEINGQDGHMVPFWNSETNQREAQFMPDYKGLAALAMNSGKVVDIQAEVIYANDDFDFERGANKTLRHKYSLFEDRGDAIGAWAGFTNKETGDFCFEVLTKADIAKVHEKTKKGEKDSPLWRVWWESAWRKTALRRALKLAPKSKELIVALNHEERIEMGKGSAFSEMLSGGESAQIDAPLAYTLARFMGDIKKINIQENIAREAAEDNYNGKRLEALSERELVELYETLTAEPETDVSPDEAAPELFDGEGES